METNHHDRIAIRRNLIEETLAALKEGGRENRETVVLWLGRRSTAGIDVFEVHVPRQTAESHWFRIPPDAMKDLMAHLRRSRYFIAAQVHSHPEEAFHSYTDDKWAIVRHAGALSLVLPYFGEHSDKGSFVRDAAVFKLSARNEWVEVSDDRIEEHYQIIDE
jgi:hypothetical protein